MGGWERQQEYSAISSSDAVEVGDLAAGGADVVGGRAIGFFLSPGSGQRGGKVFFIIGLLYIFL
jgi:hypothetical protein